MILLVISVFLGVGDATWRAKIKEHTRKSREERFREKSLKQEISDMKKNNTAQEKENDEKN